MVFVIAPMTRIEKQASAYKIQMVYLQHFQTLHCPEIARNLSSNIATPQNPRFKNLNYFE
jgi:hypothetical protein